MAFLIKTLASLFLSLFAVFLFGVEEAYSANCSPTMSGAETIGSPCSFSGTVNGVESGNITVSADLTINPGQTIVFNPGYSVVKSGAGRIFKGSGAQIKKTYLWMTDADSDGYPSSTTQIASDSTPTSGRRRSVMVSTSTIDVNDSNASCYRNGTFYPDSDGDGVGAGTPQTICYASSTPSGYSATSTDCASTDSTRWQNLNCYVDSDGDGWTIGGLTSVCKGSACNSPAGHSATSAGTDCNDGSSAYTNNCCVPNYGQSCSACSACDCNYGTITCGGGCSVGAPGNPSCYGQGCQACNSCGQCNSGSQDCGCGCSASPPSESGCCVSYAGQACSACNSCGSCNSGTYSCSGSCSASAPSNPCSAVCGSCTWSSYYGRNIYVCQDVCCNNNVYGC